MTDLFAGLGLHVDLVQCDIQQPCEALADRCFNRPELRFLREDRDIHVADDVSTSLQFTHGPGEENAGIRPFPLRLGIRIGIADVAQGQCPQDGIGQGVQHHVRIGVADQTLGMLNAKATQPKRAARFQPVGVVAGTNAYHWMPCSM